MGVPAGSKVYDIGQILPSQNASHLSDHQKYLTLNKHFCPLSCQMKYLQKVLHGCNRSCKSSYLLDNFLYNKTKDEVYCIYCALFLTEEKRKSLKCVVKLRYSGWHNIEKENKHIGNTYPWNAVQEALEIKGKMKTLSTLYLCRMTILFPNKVKRISNYFASYCTSYSSPW